MAEKAGPYVSRAGLKLAFALDAFALDVRGWTCADLGANVGGFTDCLLQRGATRVYAVDTAYGVLAWKLRRDRRVVVMERANALHARPPEPVDLVVVDVGWTPQRLILPAAAGWLKPGGTVVSLLKPHYEASAGAGKGGGRHVLTLDAARRQCLTTCRELAGMSWRVWSVAASPLPGAGGNFEFLLWTAPPVR